MFYAEACNELAGPISASLRSGNTAPFKKISQRWQAVATLCLIWPERDLDLRPPVPETNALPLDQLAGAMNYQLVGNIILCLFVDTITQQWYWSLNFHVLCELFLLIQIVCQVWKGILNHTNITTGCARRTGGWKATQTNFNPAVLRKNRTIIILAIALNSGGSWPFLKGKMQII